MKVLLAALCSVMMAWPAAWVLAEGDAPANPPQGSSNQGDSETGGTQQGSKTAEQQKKQQEEQQKEQQKKNWEKALVTPGVKYEDRMALINGDPTLKAAFDKFMSADWSDPDAVRQAAGEYAGTLSTRLDPAQVSQIVAPFLPPGADYSIKTPQGNDVPVVSLGPGGNLTQPGALTQQGAQGVVKEPELLTAHAPNHLTVDSSGKIVLPPRVGQTTSSLPAQEPPTPGGKIPGPQGTNHPVMACHVDSIRSQMPGEAPKIWENSVFGRIGQHYEDLSRMRAGQAGVLADKAATQLDGAKASWGRGDYSEAAKQYLASLGTGLQMSGNGLLSLTDGFGALLKDPVEAIPGVGLARTSAEIGALHGAGKDVPLVTYVRGAAELAATIPVLKGLAGLRAAAPLTASESATARGLGKVLMGEESALVGGAAKTSMPPFRQQLAQSFESLPMDLRKSIDVDAMAAKARELGITDRVKGMQECSKQWTEVWSAGVSKQTWPELHEAAKAAALGRNLTVEEARDLLASSPFHHKVMDLRGADTQLFGHDAAFYKGGRAVVTDGDVSFFGGPHYSTSFKPEQGDVVLTSYAKVPATRFQYQTPDGRTVAFGSAESTAHHIEQQASRGTAWADAYNPAKDSTALRVSASYYTPDFRTAYPRAEQITVYRLNSATERVEPIHIPYP